MIDFDKFSKKFPNAKIRKSVPEQIEARNQLFEEREANIQEVQPHITSSIVDIEREVRYPTKSTQYYTGD
jgi:hypothetical protein